MVLRNFPSQPVLIASAGPAAFVYISFLMSDGRL